ncbi:hypothetical protein M8818_004362 [Zalaria obscura]|uniref:Uncharacterized protein n=1 Tax=Zalaria obscura TaxID=2024903 RepID=A0ACC3SAX3_9PEZI
MTTDYFSDYQSFITSKSLPSPADTPYDTPNLGSRRSSRHRIPGRTSTSTPPPLPADVADRQDGKQPAYDPKRFTPTLHASLVSEILNLRRELDSKHSFIDNLESSFHAVKEENDTLTNRLLEHNKQSRLNQRKLDHFEQGASDAIEELLEEKESQTAANEELRAKIDALNKKSRRHEDDVLQSQQIWEREKQSWENERRQLEMRVHVTESRLRAFVDEMNAQPASIEKRERDVESGGVETFKDSGFGNESDTASIRSYRKLKHRRNMSSISLRSSSHSVTGMSPGKGNGFNLADEMKFEEEDEYDLDEFEHEDDDLLYDSRRERILESRQSSRQVDMDAKAKKVLGITKYDESRQDGILPSSLSAGDKGSLQDDSFRTGSSSDSSRMQPSEMVEPQASGSLHQYVDRGVQPTPPLQVSVRPAESLGPENPSSNGNALQRLHTTGFMVSSASQTGDLPISPPATPRLSVESAEALLAKQAQKPHYFSIQTQTDFADEAAGLQQSPAELHPQQALPIPSIAIHPPRSPASSPRHSTVLPPGTRNAVAQTDMGITSPSCGASVQTEEIRIDRRRFKLPEAPLLIHRHPSPIARVDNECEIAPSIPIASPPISPSRSISSTFSRTNSGTNVRAIGPFKALPLPRPVLLPSPTEERAPTWKEKGPVNRTSQYGVSHPMRSSSLLAGLQDDLDGSEYDTDMPSEAESKDVFGATTSLARTAVRAGYAGLPKTVPEDQEISPEHGTLTMHGAFPNISRSASKGSNRRANVMHSSRMGNQYLRSRTPSVTSAGSSSVQSQPPPFPIPTRSSSRVMKDVSSDGLPSPSPFDGDSVTSRRTQKPVQVKRKTGLRKVQSATGLRQSPQNSPRRRRRSPNLTPIQSMAFESPATAKLPIPDLPTPLQHGPFVGETTLQEASMNIDETGASKSGEAMDTSLVDAIAATMVGEWMWKYVRRRKSFGVGEQDFPKNGEEGGVRHKRWVWLSPYERTVMWSTKQPVTGNALLGKSGRKLLIKSVLDVKDDNPPPKGATQQTVFNRSILVLTPARALKFTATDRERHHLWLTALSFLAHPSRDPPQVPRLRPIPIQDQEISSHLQGPFKRRPAIRDSVTIAKDRTRPAPLNLALAKPSSYTPSNAPSTAATADPLPTADASPGSAEPPNIPRLYSSSRHARKRSSTNPTLPGGVPLSLSLNRAALSFRSFSANNAPPPSAASASASASGHRTALTASSARSSRRTSVASPERPNFFEAVGGGLDVGMGGGMGMGTGVGTVRMEAFVDPGLMDGVLYVPPPPASARLRRGGGGGGLAAVGDGRRKGSVFVNEAGEDPFRGF